MSLMSMAGGLLIPGKENSFGSHKNKIIYHFLKREVESIPPHLIYNK